MFVALKDNFVTDFEVAVVVVELIVAVVRVVFIDAVNNVVLPLFWLQLL